MAVKNSTGVFAGFPIGFNRGNPIPLDQTSIWETFSDAAAYAQNNPVAYVGQILAVTGGDDEEAKAYIIADETGKLIEVGSEAVGDEKSIILDGGILKLFGFDGAEAGAQLTKNADGVLAWVVPSTETVEGLQTTVGALTTNVNDLTGRVSANGSAIEILQADSTTEGSVAYQIAEIVAGADSNYDTLKEIANWITNDTTGAAKMASDISTNANDIDALETLVGTSSVSSQISDAIAAALQDGENEKYALASDLTTTNGNVTTNASAISALEALVGESSVSDQIAAALQVDGAEKYALASHTHTISEITNLQNTLNGKADTSVTDDLASRLSTVENLPAVSITAEDIAAWNEDSGEANVIERITIRDNVLPINNKVVDIPFADASTWGVVKPDDTSVEINMIGNLAVKAVHVSKLYMDEGDELILNGGDATTGSSN